uniref:Uncharacterized protein n=1 Tax=Myotis myotis TaxID=51298 RepID=A0A7J7ZYF5_MYOMY|nr:hypothetical protein mMyoMyo1_009977 [Myotis myotis]
MQAGKQQVPHHWGPLHRCGTQPQKGAPLGPPAADTCPGLVLSPHNGRSSSPCGKSSAAVGHRVLASQRLAQNSPCARGRHTDLLCAPERWEPRGHTCPGHINQPSLKNKTAPSSLRLGCWEILAQ